MRLYRTAAARPHQHFSVGQVICHISRCLVGCLRQLLWVCGVCGASLVAISRATPARQRSSPHTTPHRTAPCRQSADASDDSSASETSGGHRDLERRGALGLAWLGLTFVEVRLELFQSLLTNNHMFLYFLFLKDLYQT